MYTYTTNFSNKVISINDGKRALLGNSGKQITGEDSAESEDLARVIRRHLMLRKLIPPMRFMY